jgi:RNA polymerase sigma-70 factor (ECF subfamily)
MQAALRAHGDCATLAFMTQARDVLEQVFREEYGRIIATLIRQSGSFDLAEEALNEAFVAAAESWERDGSPRGRVVDDGCASQTARRNPARPNAQRQAIRDRIRSHTLAAVC